MRVRQEIGIDVGFVAGPPVQIMHTHENGWAWVTQNTGFEDYRMA